MVLLLSICDSHTHTHTQSIDEGLSMTVLHAYCAALLLMHEWFYFAKEPNKSHFSQSLQLYC